MRLLYFVVLLTLVCPLWTQAQGTVEGENFDVVKAYEPVLADAVKVNISPDLPSYDELSKNKPSFKDYYVPNRLLSLTYEPPALKPIPYHTDKDKNKDKSDADPYHAWLRAGYGNLRTPLLEVAVSSGKSERFTVGANGFYNASKGKIDLQQLSNVGGLVFGKVVAGQSSIGLQAGYKQHSTYYYGFDHADTSLNIIADSVRQRYGTLEVGANVGNNTENNAQVNYLLDANFKRFASLGAHENNLNLQAQVGKIWNEHIELGAKTYFFYTQYTPLDNSSNRRTALNLTPHFSYRAAFGDFTVGASALMSVSKWTAFPYLQLQAHLLPNRLTLFGTWKKDVQENDYIALAAANPFVAEQLATNNALVQERAVGLRGKVGSTVSFSLKGFQTISDRQALYVNDFADPTRRFGVLYDSLTTATGAQLELGVRVSNAFDAQWINTYQTYRLNNVAEAWHLPRFKSNLLLNVRPTEKLLLSSDIFVLQGMQALQADQTATTLPLIADLNVAARYQIIRQLYVFANANNLLGKQYERFYQYKNFGIQALGGIVLRF